MSRTLRHKVSPAVFACSPENERTGVGVKYIYSTETNMCVSSDIGNFYYYYFVKNSMAKLFPSNFAYFTIQIIVITVQIGVDYGIFYGQLIIKQQV